MKTKTFIIALISLSIVFGYGHELADEKFLKWLCVLVWAMSIVFLNTMKDLDEN